MKKVLALLVLFAGCSGTHSIPTSQVKEGVVTHLSSSYINENRRGPIITFDVVEVEGKRLLVMYGGGPGLQVIELATQAEKN